VIGSILVGLGLLVISVVVQVFAVLLMLRHLARLAARGKLGVGIWRDAWSLSVMMVVLFVGHLVQIAFWAWLFVALGEFSDFATAYYHAFVNFTSLGYGDMVMSEQHRLLGALEAGNGVLMFGLSAAAIFAVLMKLFESRVRVVE
jgi:hypothetical protein